MGVVNNVTGGFVLSKYWEWFVLPAFPGLPQLSVAACIGVMLTVSLFNISSVAALYSKDAETPDYVRKLAVFMGYWIFLLWGFVWSLFL